MTGGRRLKRRLLIALGLFATAAFLALGMWQIERRAWKLDLIARVDARVHASPQPAPSRDEWPGFDAREHVYRRVQARGVFLHERETLVQAVTGLGGGHWVLTPLRTDSGIILVNRGFVPPERRVPGVRAAGQTPCAVLVTGLVRASEPGGGFLRSNDPAAGRWYSRDAAAIGRAQGFDRVAPYFIDADGTPNPGGWPRGGLTVVSFRNNHLSYALTWFALAALSAGGVLLTWRGQP